MLQSRYVGIEFQSIWYTSRACQPFSSLSGPNHFLYAFTGLGVQVWARDFVFFEIFLDFLNV